MRVAPLFLIAATVAVAGCAEPPFVQRELTNTIDKPTDTVTRLGMVSVCHGDGADWSEVEAEAAYACGAQGYFAKYDYTNRYQCRVTAPHLSAFSCYHPEMTDAAGNLINPSDEKAVAAWQKRTGKMKPKPRVALPVEQQTAPPATLPSQPMAAQPVAASPGASTGAAAPVAPVAPVAPAPVTAPYRPLSPADIAGKPGLAPALILAEPPPQVPLYPSGGSYTLQPESWGQQFDK